MFKYKVFAYLVIILIKKYVRNIDCIIIDNEYPGWEPLIKDIIVQGVRKMRGYFSHDQISFASIGKKSRAHKTAYAVHKDASKVNQEVFASDVIKLILK